MSLRVFRSARFHRYAMATWALLVIPTVLWWRDSILWVSCMSLYALVSAHWTAYQSARTEEHLKKTVQEALREVLTNGKSRSGNA